MLRLACWAANFEETGGEGQNSRAKVPPFSEQGPPLKVDFAVIIRAFGFSDRSEAEALGQLAIVFVSAHFWREEKERSPPSHSPTVCHYISWTDCHNSQATNGRRASEEEKEERQSHRDATRACVSSRNGVTVDAPCVTGALSRGQN